MSQISRGAGLFRTEIRRILSLLEKASDGRGRRGVWVWAISSDSHRPSPTVCDSAGLSSEGFCPPVARTEPVSPTRLDSLSGELLDPEWSGAWHGRAVGGWHPAAHTLASCRGCCLRGAGPPRPALAAAEGPSVLLGTPPLPPTGFLLPTAKEPPSARRSSR